MAPGVTFHKVLIGMAPLRSGIDSPVYAVKLIRSDSQGETHREHRPVETAGISHPRWYGVYHHGKATAIGERFSMYRLTAAHRTLPIGTTAVVTHLRTRRQVVIRINGRRPCVNPRRHGIDLSQAAARRLGFEHPSLAPVHVVVQKAPVRSTRVVHAPSSRHGQQGENEGCSSSIGARLLEPAPPLRGCDRFARRTGMTLVMRGNPSSRCSGTAI
jgi:rare lipoprotein A (peptidoglycan hydrolase)